MGKLMLGSPHESRVERRWRGQVSFRKVSEFQTVGTNQLTWGMLEVPLAEDINITTFPDVLQSKSAIRKKLLKGLSRALGRCKFKILFKEKTNNVPAPISSNIHVGEHRGQ